MRVPCRRAVFFGPLRCLVLPQEKNWNVFVYIPGGYCKHVVTGRFVIII